MYTKTDNMLMNWLVVFGSTGCTSLIQSSMIRHHPQSSTIEHKPQKDLWSIMVNLHDFVTSVLAYIIILWSKLHVYCKLHKSWCVFVTDSAFLGECVYIYHHFPCASALKLCTTQMLYLTNSHVRCFDNVIRWTSTIQKIPWSSTGHVLMKLD